MNELILSHEPTIRLSAFLGIFALMALWELAAPRRARERSLPWRWVNNLGLVALNTVLVRGVFPLLAVGMATLASQRQWGLLHQYSLPDWLALILAVLALDLAIYFQHLMFHAVPLFWRLHRMHHTDVDLDVTSGARFHPLEILLSMGIKLALVVLLGASPVAVVIFEVLLNGTAMFNHANVRMPLGLDRLLRWGVVTPDMHRVHHSIVHGETNSNFGFNLPWWDRLFGTYRAQPAAGHTGMTVGLEAFREPREIWLNRLLIQPLLGGHEGSALHPPPAVGKTGAGR